MAIPPNAGQGTSEARERMPSSGAALEKVFQDIRFGLRLLRREPGFVATTVLTLALAIGLRLTMGARPLDVVRMVVVGAVVLAGSGVALGAVAAIWTSQFLTSLLFEVAPTDVATLAGVTVLLLLVGASAAWLPARRAARVDPLVALRAE